MTAEIAILNTVAIALAADSAVTVKSRYGDEINHKIYNTTNKLFMLSKYHPVGIMIYGNADLLRVPWEVIIKNYRGLLGKNPFDDVQSYGMDFINFLSGFFSEQAQEKYVYESVASFFFAQLLEEINLKVDKYIQEHEEIEHEKVELIVSDVINVHLGNLIKREKLSCFPDDFDQEIINTYKKQIEEAISNVFEKLPLSSDDLENLRKITGCLLSRNIFQSNASGIVIAGFGETDIFPGVFSIQIDGVAKGKLKYRVEHNIKINTDTNAMIIPFAQQEMVVTFIEGIDPSLKQLIDGYLSQLFESYSDVIINKLPISDDAKKELNASLLQESKNILKNLNDNLLQYKQEKHISPILSAVSVLPKDELAAMAESLVNLTSFKRKVSMQAETVGGPIDVAVISKGDGFVWIKRKHYFAPELNHHFFTNYFSDCGEDKS